MDKAHQGDNPPVLKVAAVDKGELAAQVIEDDVSVTPSVHITSVTFSDGQKLSFSQSDVVVLVGPNNSGKSLCLRELQSLLAHPTTKTFALTDIEYASTGTKEELEEWLAENSYISGDSRNRTYSGYGYGVNLRLLNDYWGNPSRGLNSLADVFCVRLSADDRLRLANPPESIKRVSQAPTHPIHYLYLDDSLAEKVSKLFKKAFGKDLIVHYAAGKEIPLHTGDAPIRSESRDRVSKEYIEDLEMLPRLDKQGDGMRSFAGILLHSVLMARSINLIDEPEAFLHPPQARLLGQLLVGEGGEKPRQTFIATHSRDILHGVLDANSTAVRVIRIQRDGDINRVSELNNDNIKTLWNDPLLRYSNVLSGVFHEHVVLCESDGDCRFYQAVADALFENLDTAKQPDVLFIHCGGKQRMPQIIKALRGLNVPVSVTPDFDVLNNDRPLRDIIESYGLDWNQFEKDWKIIKSHVDQSKPELKTSEVKREVDRILSEVTSDNFPREHADEISSACSLGKLSDVTSLRILSTSLFTSDVFNSGLD